MDLRLDDATGSDRPLVARMLQLYLHDFSDFAGYLPGADGLFEYPWFDAYWRDDDRHVVVFRVDRRPAGFAFLRDLDATVVAEFFVLRGFRRSGVGRAAAHRLFADRPGAWRVRQLASNPAATRFWEAVIPVPFDRAIAADGSVEQRFAMPARP